MADKTTALLLILDGWGHREAAADNAIHAARSPVWDRLWSERPHTLIHTSGKAVGLPAGQMGNSEVGHTNIGAGRVVYQSLTRIDKDIEDGGFQRNPVLLQAVAAASAAGTTKAAKTSAADATAGTTASGAVHILGLLSPGGIHSHEDHLLAMAQLALDEGAAAVFIHAFLDGRDTPPRSALPSLQRADAFLRQSGRGRVASMTGRFYAMDRDKRWPRTEAAYRMLTEGECPFRYEDVASALEAAYARDEDDEFVQPTFIGGDADNSADNSAGGAGKSAAKTGEAATTETALQHSGIINDGDSVIFMNFRADRARQLSRAFVNDDFDSFPLKVRPRPAAFATLCEYAADIKAPCAYPPQELHNTLGEYLAAQSKTQLRIAETEKYAHVTFFLNGGREQAFPGEERILVPSPKVKTYDLKPEMSVFEVTEQLTKAIRAQKYDAIVCNFANGDMVGHTGDFAAAVKAVEAVDRCLGEIVKAITDVKGELLITADHGNVEQMTNPSSGQALTSHTDGPVPLVYVGPRRLKFKAEGSLSDLAPTLLTLLNMPVPAEMTGTVLLEQA